MHLSETNLRAFLDHQLSEQAEQSAAAHLDGCDACRQRLNRLAQRRARVHDALSVLESGEPVNPPTARAYSHLMQIKENHAMKRSNFLRSRLLWASLTLIVVMVVSFSFPTVRAWAGQFLGLFRVEQVTVLPLDFSRMEDMYGDTNFAATMRDMMAESVEFTKQPSDSYLVDSLDEASAAVGFALRSPAGVAPTAIEVQDDFAFKFRVDRELAQSLLDEAGRSDLVLPASLDNADISASVPARAVQYFGNCDPEHQDNNARDCQMLLQIQSPVVDTPPDIDLAQLAQIGLMFAGMSEQDAAEFSQSIDWNATLVVPIPESDATHENVMVDGVTGSLIRSSSDPDNGPQHYILLWVKDGIVYSLTSSGDLDSGLALANALQ